MVGNIKSLQFAFQRLGIDAILTNTIEKIVSADKVIFRVWEKRAPPWKSSKPLVWMW